MHALLRTTRRSAAQPSGVRPVDAEYEFAKGIWVGSGGPLCNDPDHMPQSKKADIETGEDQKGQ